MSKYVETPATVVNPGWTGRNEAISKNIAKNVAVLDLGCGAKDLLKYISPSRYTGIDYLTNEYADIKLDFNTEFDLPGSDWDYIICSGLIEYLADVNHFFSRIKGHSKYVIVTFWIGAKDGINNPTVLKSVEEFSAVFEKHFEILKTERWAGHHIYVGLNQ